MVERLEGDRLQEVGREVVQVSLGVLRTIQTHGHDNAALRNGVERLAGLLSTVHVDPEQVLSLQSVDQLPMLNGTRLRAHGTMSQQLHQFVSFLGERGLGGFEVRGAPTADALRRWFVALGRRATTPDEQALLWAELERFGADGLAPLEPRVLQREAHDDTLRVSTLAFALQSWARAVLGFREFIEAIAAGKDPYRNRLNVVRVVQDVIDVAAARPDNLLWVLELRRQRDARLARSYDDLHAAGTCVYAVLIGELLGLERTALLDLGTAALLAGVGPALAGEDGQVGLTGADARDARRTQGTRALQMALGGETTDDAIMARTIVAYEHRHAYADAGGRPVGLHPFARVVAVAAAWDAMISDRPWRPGLLPAEAAHQLLQDAGRRFDPLIVSALLAVMGLLPEPAPQVSP